jgi:anti-sigma regulatory factor (Ser/Thr protein kinase)
MPEASFNRVHASGAEVQLCRWFPATDEAVSLARAWVREIALATGHGAIVPTLELLVSELATNAIRHTDGERFRVEFDAGAQVIVAVCDTETAVPTVQHPGPTDETGRGLAIVQGMSDRWGAEIRRDGKCVWFQLADPPARATKVS